MNQKLLDEFKKWLGDEEVPLYVRVNRMPNGDDYGVTFRKNLIDNQTIFYFMIPASDPKP